MTQRECRRQKAEYGMWKYIFYSAFCILHSALIFVSPCAADSGAVDAAPYGQRTDAFRRLLFEFRFQPLHAFAELEDNPSESLLIVLGDPRCLANRTFPQGLRWFVEYGGAVLIATDKETNGQAGEMLNQLAGVQVTDETLICLSTNAADLYDGSRYCPFVQPIADTATAKGPMSVLNLLSAAVGVGDRPALFRNPHPQQPDLRVAANAPSRLKVRGWWLPGGIHRLAQLPKDTISEDDPSDNSVAEESLFAVGGTRGKGRVLVLADHSIFINRMLLPRDNGNLEFAANCLHWLRGGVSTPTEAFHAMRGPQGLQQLTGQRNKVLFWDDGRIRTDLEVPLQMAPLKPSLAPEPVIVAAFDKTIANLEDSDFFNRKILEGMDGLSGGRPRAARIVLYLLTVTAMLFLSYLFLWRSRHRPETSIPLLADAVGQHEPKMSLLEQRRWELRRSGNVWETAHRLARECFASLGVPLMGAAPPRVEVRHGNSWQRWRTGRRVMRLWRLARGDTPTPIPPAALRYWLRELEELKTAMKDGTIQLL